MAKLTRQKAQKEYQCCKCERKIQKGELYQKIIEMYRKPRIVCSDCVIPRSELTSSEYLAWLYELQDYLQIESPDDVQSIIETLEEQKGELEDKLYNMPEQFQDGEAGSTLQERIDNLDDAILSLEQIDFDEESEETSDDRQQTIEEKLDEAIEIIMSLY